MKKKLIIALAITIIATLAVTGCAGGNGSNPAGETVASEDAISEDAVSEDAISDDVVILLESGNEEIETEENTADAQTIEMAPPVYFVPWEEAGLEDHVMDWQDENLEVAMREITGITDGDIMLSDVWEITELNLSVVNIPEKNSLEELDILQNSMLDNIKIVDISALGELTNLQQLDLAFHNVNNIDALGGLINLQNDNQISDISALGELENLRYLYIQDNPISDYSPLDGLSLDRLQKD